MNATAKELPHGQSEAEYAGLELTPSTKVRPPRVLASPVHLECRVRQILPIGDGPIAANLVIGEVLLIHIDDEGQQPLQVSRPLGRGLRLRHALTLGRGAGSGTGEHRRHVLQQLQAAVEQAARDQLQADIGIPVVHPLPTRRPR